MDIHLDTHKESKKLSLLNIADFGHGVFVCDVFVKSDWLECTQRFYFDRLYAQGFLKKLIRMNSSLAGDATLQQEFEMQFINMSCNKLGQIKVSGELIEDAIVSQSVKFMFETDQTVLPNLIKQFELLLGPHT